MYQLASELHQIPKDIEFTHRAQDRALLPPLQQALPNLTAAEIVGERVLGEVEDRTRPPD
jgi:hypothetical protein